ncbi:MAG: FAD-binding oxidoreductase [Sneathiellales bacterium]|nr:FAD-binding oxidoreductase [Sneathiellales bacterium]
MTISSNYYVANAGEPLSCPPLMEDIRADVCIIGAGFTGLGVALELLERGFTIVVLEAKTIGFGASGRSGGQIASGYSNGMIETEKKLGPALARRLWDFSELSKEILYARLENHQIACDLGKGELYATPRKSHERWLLDEKEHCESKYEYGGYKWIETEQLRSLLAGQRYRSALYDQEGGHLQPLKYTHGLAKAVLQKGGRIFEHSAALDIEQGSSVRIRTEKANIIADSVVLAGNAYLSEFDLGQRKRFIPVQSSILATEPMEQDRAAEIMKTTACICDTYHDLDYFKMTPDHRLVYGGQDLSFGRKEPQDNQIRRNMLKTFPMLQDLKIDYFWNGKIAANPLRLPDVGRVGSNIYYIQGYSGQGVTLSAGISHIVAEAIQGEMERFDIFGKIPHKDIPLPSFLHKPAVYSMLLWHRIKDLL